MNFYTILGICLLVIIVDIFILRVFSLNKKKVIMLGEQDKERRL